MVLFVVFQVDIRAEARIQLRLQFGHDVLAFFALVLDAFDLFQLLLFGGGQQLLRFRQIVRHKHLAHDEWNLLLLVEQFDLVDGLLEALQIVLFRLQLLLEVLQVRIVLGEFVDFGLVFEGNVHVGVLQTASLISARIK